MQFKPVPEPPADLDALSTVRDALPLVPKPEESCCDRIVDRTFVAESDDARDWLTFLRALRLAAETDRGYVRERRELDTDRLATAFRERAFLADDVLTALDSDEPLTTDAVFEAVSESVPRWERHNRRRWEPRWRDRVKRLLEWAVLFELAEHSDGGYRPQ